MTIKRKFFLSAFLFVGYALALFGILAASKISVISFTDSLQRKEDILRSVFSLQTLTNEYLHTRSERSLEQWYIQSRTLRTQLEDDELTLHPSVDVLLLFSGEKAQKEAEHEILHHILTDHAAMTEKFGFMVKLQYEGTPDAGEIEDRLATAIILNFQSMIDGTTALADGERARWATIRQHAVTLLYSLVSVIAVSACLVAYLLGRSILLPLNRLRDGAMIVGRGNLRHKIGIQSHDEIGDVSREFDEMTRKLRESYEGLEEKVVDRTRELEKFRRTVVDATDSIIITDVKGNIVFVNNAWQKNTGYSLKEALGKNPKILNSGKTPKEVFEKMWKTISTGKPFKSEEVINRRKDGTEYQAQVHLFPIIVDGKIEFYAEIGQDISSRKAVERMKTEFVSLASHQLRTPVSAIRWLTEALIAGKVGKLTPEAKDLIKNISEINVRMDQLVGALLNISRIESGRLTIDPQLTVLRELITDVLSELEPKIQAKKLKMSVKVPKSIEAISVDPKLIREVYRSFITNAIKYTNEKGKVAIELKKDGQMIVSEVTDSGVGIAKADQERIFQKFFRAPNAVKMDGEGNGLGLYLARTIVEASGGKIWFRSVEGNGSTFSFSLPLKGSKAQKGEISLGH